MTDITMSISPFTLMKLFFFSKDITGIFRGLNTRFSIKVVGDQELYLDGDAVTAKINGELTYAFLARTYIKNLE